MPILSLDVNQELHLLLGLQSFLLTHANLKVIGLQRQLDNICVVNYSEDVVELFKVKIYCCRGAPIQSLICPCLGAGVSPARRGSEGESGRKFAWQDARRTLAPSSTWRASTSVERSGS